MDILGQERLENLSIGIKCLWHSKIQILEIKVCTSCTYRQ